MTDRCFISISGIRGIVGQSFTAETVQKCALAFFATLQGKTVIVGRDPRPSGLAIEHILVGTLMSCGVDVFRLGICPTPTLAIAVKTLRASGGIMITASHNSIEWNALKLINDQGLFFDTEQCDHFFSLLNKDCNFTKDALSFGSENFYSKAHSDHLHLILNILDVDRIRRKNLSIFLDSVNGAGSEITPKFLETLGCTVIKKNCNIKKIFPRHPEPNKDHLKDLHCDFQKHSCDLGFVQDPDADRLLVFVPNDNSINEELTLALAFESVLSASNDPTVLVSNIVSTAFLDRIAQKYKTRLLRTPVGESHIVAEMIAHNAVIGGEGNGGVIHKRSHLGRDSLLAIGVILDFFCRNREHFQSVVEESKDFHMIKHKISMSPETYRRKQTQMEKAFPESTRTHTDGYHYSWNDSWIHIRMSNTEPILRLFVESKSEQKANDLLKESLSIFEKDL